MTGFAKQSRATKKLDCFVALLLAMTGNNQRGMPMAYVDGFIVAVPKKNLAAYRRQEGRQGLARAWRAGLPRMGGRRRQGRQAHLVPAQRQAQGKRDGGVLLD